MREKQNVQVDIRILTQRPNKNTCVCVCVCVCPLDKLTHMKPKYENLAMDVYVFMTISPQLIPDAEKQRF